MRRTDSMAADKPCRDGRAIVIARIRDRSLTHGHPPSPRDYQTACADEQRRVRGGNWKERTSNVKRSTPNVEVKANSRNTPNLWRSVFDVQRSAFGVQSEGISHSNSPGVFEEPPPPEAPASHASTRTIRGRTPSALSVIRGLPEAVADSLGVREFHSPPCHKPCREPCRNLCRDRQWPTRLTTKITTKIPYGLR